MIRQGGKEANKLAVGRGGVERGKGLSKKDTYSTKGILIIRGLV